MGSRHLSLRLDEGSFERLDHESHRQGRSRSDVARTLLEEGLRMEAHPGVVFRPGPAGRRAGLIAGPDVWEIARVLKSIPGDAGERTERTAESMGLSPAQVRAAVAYWAEFPAEIDDWVRRADDEADRAEAAWRREHDLLAE